MKLFAKLHGLELADVANPISEADYISLDHFEAYLVSHNFLLKNICWQKFNFLICVLVVTLTHMIIS